MKSKVLILGNNGMLGSMVYHYLSNNSNLIVNGTSRFFKNKDKRVRYFDVKEFLSRKQLYLYLKKYDYIINCIGIIKPYCTDGDIKGIKEAIIVNSLFPHELATFCKDSKIIQIATDCVYSGKKGDYTEVDIHDPTDVYGKSKSLGEVSNCGNFLNIRCSVVGPEIHESVNLMGWFLHQKDRSTVNGYVHHKWNGVTTLQYSILCNAIIEKNSFDKLRNIYHTFHFVPNNNVSKYQLLSIFNRVFNKQLIIKRVNKKRETIDRTLSTKFRLLNPLFQKTNIFTAVKDMSNYINTAKNSPW